MSPSTSANEHHSLAPWSLPASLKAGAFWSAVLLPFCILALLTVGLETTLHYAALVLLVGVNVLALVVGHDYGE